MTNVKRLGAVATAAGFALLVVALGVAQASPPTSASGTFTQTATTGFDLRFAGPNVIFEATVEGSVSGTLTGSYEERHTVVIHPNGRFNARATITCECTVEGKSGVVELVVVDTGVQAGPDIATFEGRAVITGATAELSGLRGVLEIEGTVDTSSGLSTVDYSGRIHFHS